jgi:23S rRNA (cytosine1962-C5)-methyltransferase
VLDRYAETLVLKLYTAAWLPRLAEIIELISERALQSLQLGALDLRMVLRLSRNIQTFAEQGFGKGDGQVLIGPSLGQPVQFLESGLKFEADVLRGQKTGFFLDQRENRRHVEALARGRTVLNAFSFSGGFSLYAARGGARSVTDLDLSAHALLAAGRNFALNQALAPIASCTHECIQADAFNWLDSNADRKFDLVILDPPSLARRETERAGAIRAYGRLAASGLDHLSPDGILVACSCSAHVSAREFFDIVRRAVQESGRAYEELEITGHAADHPATFAEAQYLKAIYCRFSPR